MQQNIKEGIDGHAATWYSDVFDLVFPNVDAAEANALWKDQLTKKKSNKDEDEDEG